MKKIRIIYFSLLIIISFFVSKIFFSYAFLTSKNEIHGKLNLIVGTLDYKLDSNDLHDNSITISSGDTKIITLSIKSLNNISSKYELYYVLENETDLVTVGFLEDSLNTKSGILEKFESKEVEVIIRNKSVSSQKIIFGVEGGLINNDLVLNDNKSSLVDYCSKEDIYTFDYTGSEQVFVIPCTGEYQLETWGAQGGNATYSATYYGGKGGYSTGLYEAKTKEVLFINVGGMGKTYYSDSSTISSINNGLGYNGGSDGSAFIDNSAHGGGGGATSIAFSTGLLSELEDKKDNVLIVSGGGGGGASHLKDPLWSGTGGTGGGFAGGASIPSSDYTYCNVSGGTQTEGGKLSANYKDSCNGHASFGIGSTSHSGGGGGYYGGAGGVHGPAAGGSGYIGNTLLTNKVMYCYECEESSEESTKTISTTNVSEEPISNYAKIGNGYAKITYLGK